MKPEELLPPPSYNSIENYQEKNKVGRPQRYVLWKDWEKWLLTQWYPFKTNDFKHLSDAVKLNRRLLIGVLLAVILIPTIFMVLIVQILA